MLVITVIKKCFSWNFNFSVRGYECTSEFLRTSLLQRYSKIIMHLINIPGVNIINFSDVLYPQNTHFTVFYLLFKILWTNVIHPRAETRVVISWNNVIALFTVQFRTSSEIIRMRSRENNVHESYSSEFLVTIIDSDLFLAILGFWLGWKFQFSHTISTDVRCFIQQRKRKTIIYLYRVSWKDKQFDH